MPKRYTTKDLSHDRLKEVLIYSPLSGGWTWRKDMGANKIKGLAAGGVDKSDGYHYIQIDGKLYKSSRLAFLYLYGYFPENEVDHIDRDRSNNTWSNLKEVSRSCNMRNTGLFSTNKTGVKGVFWDKGHKRWQSQVTVNNTRKLIGRYKTFEEAVLYRLAAEQCLGWSDCACNSSAYQYALENGIVR
jgi:hypothetical protein